MTRVPCWRALLVLGCAACTQTPRPASLDKVAEVHTAPATRDAEAWAPQAHAHALDLEQRSQRALSAGDAAGAALWADGALAAHEHAWVLARLARAERRRLSAEAELSGQQRALAELQTQEQRLSAEAGDLELRARVVKNALPLATQEAAGPERSEARRKAAAALATQGRLLCVAARLLGEADAVKDPLARLDELDRELDSVASARGAAANKAPKALETATELRGECLRVISEARRRNSRNTTPTPNGASATAPQPVVPADLVLAELSAAGQSPARDERGVSVVLRDLFASDGSVSESGRIQLQQLGTTAKAHPEFPLLLVGHTASLDAQPAMDRQLAALSSALAALGLERVSAHDAGPRQPLLPPQLPRARERNQRIELVFVAPGL
jgi:outer membrane protein OmpA-like peptidoglycan-associated protein